VSGGASLTSSLVPAIRLGLAQNLGQFSLLVLINVFVGMMVGLERTVEVYRRPENGRYQEKRICGVNDTIECASLPSVRIRIADLFA